MKYQNFHLKLPFLQILKSLQNARACLRNVICHFDEIIIISTKLQKLKTVFVKQVQSYKSIVGRTELVYSSKCFGVCVIISTIVVRCLNIEETTFAKILERRMCPFITKFKVSLNVILALFF